MTYEEIHCYAPINTVNEEKVNALVQSMLESGWKGCPILVLEGSLLTGSHRLTALSKIYDMYNNDELDEVPLVLKQDVAENVQDIVEENMAAFEEENGWVKDIDYSDIGWLLKGSWVEEYKDEIEEW